MATSVLEINNSRGKTWTDEEELALIGVYFEDYIQRMVDGTCRNTAVYRSVCLKMKELGFERSSKECQTKLNNLKSWYKKQTDRVGKPGKSGGARQRRSKLFELMDKHLADRPATRPRILVESNAMNGVDELDDVDGSQDSSDETVVADSDSSSETEDPGTALSINARPASTSTTTIQGDAAWGDVDSQSDDESQSDAPTAHNQPSTSTGATKRKNKQANTRRKVPKYEKAMGTMRLNIEELQQESDRRLQEALAASLRSQQKWEEDQRDKDRLAYQKFQEDMLAAERASMDQLGSILRSLIQPSQQQQQLHRPAPFRPSQQYNVPSFEYHPTHAPLHHPTTSTPRRPATQNANARRLIDEETSFSELLSGVSDTLNSDK